MEEIEDGTYMPTDEKLKLIMEDMKVYNGEEYSLLLPIIKDTLVNNVLQLSIVKHLKRELVKLPVGLPRVLVVNDKTFVIMYSEKQITINII